jgi:hypothetical protein
MVALGAGQAKHPLFQERIAAVPKSQTKTQILMAITNARDAVLIPTVGT